MNKAKTAGTVAAIEPGAKTPPPSWERTLRETVESIAIAFILAFLFRTFEAEAFVIPTGSMAPTLQGRHKDVVCPECGYEYRVSASSEVDRDGNRLPNCNVEAALCPMCSFRLSMDPHDLKAVEAYPSYSGDRIIVNKFAYDVSDPQRWDVVVFKYPEDAKTNYIKRLVGLPNERFQIRHGDVFTAPTGSDQFQIARKPPEKVRAMLQPVYDNDYALPKLIEAGVRPRWQPWTALGEKSNWTTSSDYQSFTAEGTSPGPAWIRYQQIEPTEEIWQRVVQHQHVTSPEPSLIYDDYAYNDGNDGNCGYPHGTPHPVGDLEVGCKLDVKNNQGAVILELVKGGRQFRCRIDLASGDAKLSISGLGDFGPTASTPIHGAGSYEVSFANVDQQLILWVDGKVITFNAPTIYDDLNNSTPVEISPRPGSDVATDLSPVGVAVEGGASVAVSHLKIGRDIYYRRSQTSGD